MRAPTDPDSLGTVARVVANTTLLREQGGMEVADGIVLTADAAVALVRRAVYDVILAVPV
jgi:hypothetical protein